MCDGGKKHWESDRIFASECLSFRKMLRRMLNNMTTPREKQSWKLLFHKEECQFEDIVASLRNATAGGLKALIVD
jgi:hypothetical protein